MSSRYNSAPTRTSCGIAFHPDVDEQRTPVVGDDEGADVTLGASPVVGIAVEEQIEPGDRLVDGRDHIVM